MGRVGNPMQRSSKIASILRLRKQRYLIFMEFFLRSGASSRLAPNIVAIFRTYQTRFFSRHTLCRLLLHCNTVGGLCNSTTQWYQVKDKARFFIPIFPEKIGLRIAQGTMARECKFCVLKGSQDPVEANVTSLVRHFTLRQGAAKIVVEV